MLNLNRVELLGNIASDPTVRSLQDGRVRNLRIAANETWKDKDTAERRSKTQFHNLTVWNEQSRSMRREWPVHHGSYCCIPTLRPLQGSQLIPDIDIWRTAALMIKHYGDTADIEAAGRADEYLARGELDGQRVWMRIAKAIDELRMVKDGETSIERECGEDF